MTNPKIKFHLDENVDGAIVRGLRKKNIDVTTTKVADLIGASDEQQSSLCTEGKSSYFYP